MKQKKRSLYFDEQYNLRISTSSLKKGEKNSLQKKDKSNYSCMYVWKEVVLATQCSKKKGKLFTFLKIFFFGLNTYFLNFAFVIEINK